MSEADHFRDAWRFLTILRIPDSPQPFAADWLARSLKYFPAVGICIGVVSAAVWLLADPIWGDTTAALLAIGAGALMSGALHEDGLADTADPGHAHRPLRPGPVSRHFCHVIHSA